MRYLLVRLIAFCLTLILAVCLFEADLAVSRASARSAAAYYGLTPDVVARAQGGLRSYGCMQCHGATLQGQKKNGKAWSPTLSFLGPVGHYSSAQFVKLMHTGKKPNGKRVAQSGHVFAKMPTQAATSIYSYLTGKP